MTSTGGEEEVGREPTAIRLEEFLESVPPNQPRPILNIGIRDSLVLPDGSIAQVYTPELQLHCPWPSCNGLRFFRYVSDVLNPPPRLNLAQRYVYLSYECSNCQRFVKTFSIAMRLTYSLEKTP
jgi:hypothetical protein